VNCTGDAFLRPGVTDLCNLRLAYANGTSAEIRLSWMSPTKEHKLTVWGETGVLVFDDTRPWEEKLTLRRIGLDWANPAVTPDPGTAEPLPLPPGEPLKAECRHFLDAATTGARPTTDGREGLAVTRLLERASASLGAEGAPR
jgi:UDP-2-acetamido-3-amino-2,3-dideoxy-glucuronate N-acetyltransferase